jgi:two-component system response regulator YesN
LSGGADLDFLQSFISKRRAFWQLYPVLFVFIFIPVVSLAFLFYSHSTSKLSEEYNKNNMNLLRQAKAAVDVIIDAIFYTSNQLYEDKRFLDLVRQMDEQSDPIIRGELTQELDRIKGGSKHVESVVLYLERSRSVLSTDYGYAPLELYPDFKFIEDSIRINDDLQLVSRKTKKSFGYDREGQQVETLIKKIPYSSDNSVIFIVNLNVNKIYEDIVKKLESNNGAELFAVDEQGNLLLYGGRSKIFPELLKITQSKSMLLSEDRQEQFLDVDVNGNTFSIVSVYSDYLRARFVWVSPKEQLFKVFNSIRSLSIINSLAVFIVLGFLAIWIVRRLSKPVEELIRVVADKSQDGVKERNVFNEITRVVKEVVSSNDVLHEKLNRMLPLYRENYLQTLLTQKTTGDADIVKGMEEYGLQMHHEFVYVIALDMINGRDLWDREQNISVYLFTMDQILEKTLQEHQIHALKVNMQDQRFALLVNLPEEDEAECKSRISRFLQHLLNRLSDDLRMEIVAGVSRRGHTALNIYERYQESCIAIRYRIIDTIPIVFADEVSVGEQRSDNLFIPLEDKLEMYLTVGDEEKANAALAEVFNQMRQTANVTAERFQEQVMILMSMLIKLAERFHVNVHSELPMGSGLFEKLIEVKTLRDAQAFFCKIIETICKVTMERRTHLENIHLTKIIDYIESHYQEDLSIDLLSEKVNISPSYIFKILRERKQTSFIEYLTQKRIEKACELLATNLKVQDIAEAIGFSSSRYFIQVFKKVKGVTPNDFRKRQQVG